MPQDLTELKFDCYTRRYRTCESLVARQDGLPVVDYSNSFISKIYIGCNIRTTLLEDLQNWKYQLEIVQVETYFLKCGILYSLNQKKFNDCYFQQESRQCIWHSDELVTGFLFFILN